MGIVVRYRKVSIPEFGIETRYRKVSIPEKGIDTQHYYLTKGLKAYIRDVNIFKYNIWIIPIHLSGHYTMIIVDNVAKKLYRLNTLSSGSDTLVMGPHFNRIMNCFHFAAENQYPEYEFNIQEWSFCVPHSKIQFDTTSCGDPSTSCSSKVVFGIQKIFEAKK